MLCIYTLVVQPPWRPLTPTPHTHHLHHRPIQRRPQPPTSQPSIYPRIDAHHKALHQACYQWHPPTKHTHCNTPPPTISPPSTSSGASLTNPVTPSPSSTNIAKVNPCCSLKKNLGT